MDELRMPAIVVALFLSELVVSIGQRKTPRSRPTVIDLASGVAHALGQLAIVMLCFSGGWWTWRESKGPFMSIVVGAITAFLLLRSWEAWHRGSAQDEGTTRQWLASLTAVWPRQRWARSLVVTRTVFTSTTEEIARCIFAFGASGSELTAGRLAFAVAFNAALHLYQGRKHLGFHVLVSFISIGLIAKLGLLAAIVFHVTYNVNAFAFDRRAVAALKQWREHERRQRAAARAIVAE